MTFLDVQALYDSPRRKFLDLHLKRFRGRFSILKVDDRTFCLLLGPYLDDEKVVTFELSGSVIFHKYPDAAVGLKLYNDITPSHHRLRKVGNTVYWYDSREENTLRQWLIPFCENDLIDADSKYLRAAFDKKL